MTIQRMVDSWHVSVVSPESNRTSSNARSYPIHHCIHHELNRRRADILSSRQANFIRCVKILSMDNSGTVHRLVSLHGWTPPSTYILRLQNRSAEVIEKGLFSVASARSLRHARAFQIRHVRRLSPACMWQVATAAGEN